MFSSIARRRVAAITAAGALALALVLAACSSPSPSSTATPGATVTVPGADAAANAYMNKLYKSAVSSGKTNIVIYGPAESTSVGQHDVFSARFPGITFTSQDQADAASLSKLAAEESTGNHVADIFMGGGPTTAVAAAKPGTCAVADIQTAPAAQVALQNDGRLIPYSYKYFTIVYNTDNVTKAEAPKSWNDLLDPKWKGKMEMSDPTVLGGLRFVMADLLIPATASKWGEPYLTKLAAQNVNIATSEPSVPADVASGRFDIGIGVFSGYTQAVIAKGGHVAAVFPMADGGLFFSSSAICLVQGGPDADAASLYTNWLFTQEGQKTLAVKSNSYGTLPGAPGPGGAPTFDKVGKLPSLPNDRSLLASEFATIDKLFKKS
jgi:iron(III) transport system substrate-binding protein